MNGQNVTTVITVTNWLSEKQDQTWNISNNQDLFIKSLKKAKYLYILTSFETNFKFLDPNPIVKKNRV